MTLNSKLNSLLTNRTILELEYGYHNIYSRNIDDLEYGEKKIQDTILVLISGPVFRLPLFAIARSSFVDITCYHKSSFSQFEQKGLVVSVNAAGGIIYGTHYSEDNNNITMKNCTAIKLPLVKYESHWLLIKK